MINFKYLTQGMDNFSKKITIRELEVLEELVTKCQKHDWDVRRLGRLRRYLKRLHHRGTLSLAVNFMKSFSL